MMMSWVAEHEGAVGGERELRAAGRGGERERTISLFTSAWNWNDSARTAGGADAATRSERKSRAGRIFRPATLMADTWHDQDRKVSRLDHKVDVSLCNGFDAASCLVGVNGTRLASVARYERGHLIFKGSHPIPARCTPSST